MRWKSLKKTVKLIKVKVVTYKIKDNDGIYYEIKDLVQIKC